MGFINVGNWTLNNDNIQYQLASNQKAKNVLYSFVSDGEIMYIGKTTMQLTKRMYGYQKPGTSQRTNIRVNDKIKTLLTTDQPLEILIFRDLGLHKYNDFSINLAGGLEDTLIYELNPAWNYSGKNKTIEDKSSNTDNLIQISYPNTLKRNRIGTFEVILGQAYYNQGFFNIKKRYSDQFGADKSIIEIRLGDNPKNAIQGYINRTANNNGTPRVMMGKEYTEWIKKNFKPNDILIVDILSAVSLRLNEK
jgi:hypothetical protein